MKVLVVEDDREHLRFLQDELRDTLPGIALTAARSQAEAARIIDEHGFDLAIVDLRLPSETDRGDTSTSHGGSVLSYLRNRHRGLPIVIYSAYADLNDVGHILTRAPQHNIIGTPDRFPLVQWIPKDESAALFSYVEQMSIGLTSVDSIPINSGIYDISLTYFQSRVVRLFAHLRGGSNIWIAPVTEGLAGALTVRLTVRNFANTQIAACIAKINDVESINDEYRRYSEHVAANLKIGSFAHYVSSIEAGASDLGGLFFRLADEYSRSLFDLLENGAHPVAPVVEQLEDVESPWRDNAPAQHLSVGSLRRELVSDHDLPADLSSVVPNADTAESYKVQVLRCTQHGDLHGCNVLVEDNTLKPVFIDYGDVGLGCSALDPVTLELSLLFHPSSPIHGHSWPSVEQCLSWLDIRKYLGGCPVPDFVRACRSWSYRAPTTDREVAALAYGYAVRQLKYPDTDHDKAAAVAEGCAQMIVG